jgi:hypothetical protein
MAHDAASSAVELALDGLEEASLGAARETEYRSARRRRSIRVAQTTRKERERALCRALDLEDQTPRPRTRAECVGGPRPCPYVACRHHLYLDVSPGTGTIKLNFPELEVWELDQSCALDVADSGEHELGTTGHLLNVTRERIRQIEAAALEKLLNAPATRELGDPALSADSRR